MNNRTTFYGILVSLIAAGVTLLLGMNITPAQAQTNLLENPGFNEAGQYRASRQFPRPDFNFAPGWDGWQTNTPSTEVWMNIEAVAYPHVGPLRREGDASQQVGRGDATFTAAAFQRVGNIAEGTTLRASVWVFQENNADRSDARTRIGIGSNVGANPFGGDIKWSPWLFAINSWQEISVEATVPAGEVTIFIYSTQTFPNTFPGTNNAYYDDAKLIAVGEGTPDVGEPDATAAPPTSTPRPFAPFVSPQEAAESGEIVHIVQSGDTLAAIAVAYGTTIQNLRELNNIDGSLLSPGQQILVREASAAPPTQESQPTTAPSVAQQPTATPQTVAEANPNPNTNTVNLSADAFQVASWLADGQTQRAAISPQRPFLAVLDANGTLRLFDTSIDREIFNLSFTDTIALMEFSDDGSRLLISFTNGRFVMIDVTSVTQIADVTIQQGVLTAVAAYNNILVTTDVSGNLAIRNQFDPNVVERSIELPQPASRLEFSQDGTTIIVYNSTGDVIYALAVQ